jgi:hypothetical protein
MVTEIKDITPGGSIPSRRSRRRGDDDYATEDFGRWMAGATAVNDDATPKRPLTQRPMTSLEDMLMLARAREQIEDAAVNAGAPVSIYEEAEARDAGVDMAEGQYTFDFISPFAPGVRLDEQV